MSKLTNPGQSLRSLLDVVLTLSLITLSGTLVWYLFTQSGTSRAAGNPRPAPSRASRVQPPLPTEPVSLKGAVLKGEPTAKVAVLLYTDFQCPYCGNFARDTMPALMEKYVKTGKVIFALRHFPLDQIHRDARSAAVALECAAKQNHAWEMHDRLFSNQKAFDEQSLFTSAEKVGLDKTLFQKCTAAKDYTQINADLSSGATLGVTGTPTFFIGKVQDDHRIKLVERVPGAVPATQWDRSLENWLKEQGVK